MENKTSYHFHSKLHYSDNIVSDLRMMYHKRQLKSSDLIVKIESQERREYMIQSMRHCFDNTESHSHFHMYHMLKFVQHNACEKKLQGEKIMYMIQRDFLPNKFEFDLLELIHKRQKH